ncbi:MAG: IS21 family transposase [Candidatus Sabulitectum sp.]|nr:IS21 family transposase [Candidatus Sabulitectum sp.]
MDNTTYRTRCATIMKDSGMQVTQIATTLGIHRSTVYRWLNGKGTLKTRRPSKLDPFKEHIDARLRKYNLPATVMIREIKDMGYAGGMTILKDYMLLVKSAHVQRLVDRFETDPGRQGQMDWGECGSIIHHGRRRKLHLFLFILGYSRYMWAEFTTSSKRPELFRLLEKSFGEIGGVVEEIVFDNMRQVVDVPRGRSGPAIINSEFTDFSRWTGFTPVASPPYWPQAKGKVERGIRYIKESFLEGRQFTDLNDLNVQLRIWLHDVANQRIHGTVKEKPAARLQRELPHMNALSIGHYPSVTKTTRLVAKDGMISYRGVRYSIDPTVITGRKTQVDVLESTDYRISVKFGEMIIANHAIADSGSPEQIDPRHAAIRRELTAVIRDYKTPMRGKAPKFEQCIIPGVEERPLSVYEEVALACV